jgi:hypothetical protein
MGTQRPDTAWSRVTWAATSGCSPNNLAHLMHPILATSCACDSI